MRQKTLATDFETWKLNDAEYFWSEVIKTKSTDLSLALTETSLIRIAAPLADDTCKEDGKQNQCSCWRGDQMATQILPQRWVSLLEQLSSCPPSFFSHCWDILFVIYRWGKRKFDRPLAIKVTSSNWAGTGTGNPIRWRGGFAHRISHSTKEGSKILRWCPFSRRVWNHAVFLSDEQLYTTITESIMHFLSTVRKPHFTMKTTKELYTSDKDQVLYNEAAVWFRSMLGRDTESAIRNLQNIRFREPWVVGVYTTLSNGCFYNLRRKIRNRVLSDLPSLLPFNNSARPPIR